MGVTPLSSKMASKLQLGACGEGTPLNSPLIIPSPTPLRRRLLYRGVPAAVADVMRHDADAAMQKNDVIVLD